jgi:hypothetical protein
MVLIAIHPYLEPDAFQLDHQKLHRAWISAAGPGDQVNYPEPVTKVRNALL